MKKHSYNNESKEVIEKIIPVETLEEITPVVSEEKENVIEPILIDESVMYNAEVIERFGKLTPGSKIEKKGSIIEILLEKKLIKLI